jgi:hypothetical protein
VDAPNSAERGWIVVIVVRRYATQLKGLWMIHLVMPMKNAKNNAREISSAAILASICVINAKMETCPAQLKSRLLCSHADTLKLLNAIKENKQFVRLNAANYLSVDINANSIAQKNVMTQDSLAKYLLTKYWIVDTQLKQIVI